MALSASLFDGGHPPPLRPGRFPLRPGLAADHPAGPAVSTPTTMSTTPTPTFRAASSGPPTAWTRSICSVLPPSPGTPGWPAWSVVCRSWYDGQESDGRDGRDGRPMITPPPRHPLYHALNLVINHYHLITAPCTAFPAAQTSRSSPRSSGPPSEARGSPETPPCEAPGTLQSRGLVRRQNQSGKVARACQQPGCKYPSQKANEPTYG